MGTTEYTCVFGSTSITRPLLQTPPIEIGPTDTYVLQ